MVVEVVLVLMVYAAVVVKVSGVSANDVCVSATFMQVAVGCSGGHGGACSHWEDNVHMSDSYDYLIWRNPRLINLTFQSTSNWHVLQ